jgi:ABC-type glycerol-3-phosphate transport system permease component
MELHSADHFAPSGCNAILTSQFGVTDWGPRMAAYTVATIPLVILFVFGMRYYIRGITSGAVKA